MSTIWYTADLHLGHARIIELCNRPFASVEEMDETIIERWNKTVARNDIVYVVGDFAFTDNAPYLARLNGQKHLICGNHDDKRHIKSPRWTTISDFRTVRDHGSSVVLCHYALRVWPGHHRGAVHLFGHSHGNLRSLGSSCDVGVDCWNFTPITLETARSAMAAPKPFASESADTTS